MECRPPDRILRPLAVALAVGLTAHSPARRGGGMRDGVPHLPRRSGITRGRAGIAAGSIVGIGSGVGAERTYAIVGGTGEYTGARGSYTAQQDTYGFGGNGTAKFALTLFTED